MVTLVAMRGNKALGSSRDSSRDSKNATFQSRDSENPLRSRDSEKSVEATVALDVKVIKCPSPLNVLKYTHDHSCY